MLILYLVYQNRKYSMRPCAYENKEDARKLAIALNGRADILFKYISENYNTKFIGDMPKDYKIFDPADTKMNQLIEEIIQLPDNEWDKLTKGYEYKILVVNFDKKGA